MKPGSQLPNGPTDLEVFVTRLQVGLLVVIIFGPPITAWWFAGWPAALTYFMGMLATPAVVIVWFFWMPRRIW